MKKTTFYILFILLSYSSVLGQNHSFTASGENAIYKKEWSVGLRFHTNAVSGFYEYVWIKDIKKRKLIQINLFGYSDYRNKKTKSIIPRYSQDPLAKKYHYGKKNSFYSVQMLYGIRRVIANKSEEDGVKLSLTFMGGASLGIVKPYYLDLYYIVNDDAIIKVERYSEENKEDFLDKSIISGYSGFLEGVDKLSIAPGVTAKVGLNFDFARKSNLVTSLEIGSQIDVFYKKLDLYVEGNKPYILNLYLSMQIGKRN